MSALCQVSWIFYAPCFTVHSTVPHRRKNSEHTRDTFGGKCPLWERFWVRGYLRGGLEYLSKIFSTFLPPALASLSLRARAARKPITLLQTLCCKIFVLKYFRSTPTLRKFFNTKIFPIKISCNKNFLIYGKCGISDQSVFEHKREKDDFHQQKSNTRNLGVLNSTQMLLPTKPLELWNEADKLAFIHTHSSTHRLDLLRLG